MFVVETASLPRAILRPSLGREGGIAICLFKTKFAGMRFITFCNLDYRPSADRILREASDSGWFDNVRSYSELDLPLFFQKHRLHMAAHGRVKFGYFIWKPSVILAELSIMSENDILVYADSGMKINRLGEDRLRDYMSILEGGQNALTFATGQKYVGQHYVKADAVAAYFPDFYQRTDTALYAGILILRNTEKTREAILDWQELCENTQFITPGPSVSNADPKFFIGQDADNGLFQMVARKHGFFSIVPDEINLYDAKGNQVVHAYGAGKYRKIDWTPLDHVPFQVRRIRWSEET